LIESASRKTSYEDYKTDYDNLRAAMKSLQSMEKTDEVSKNFSEKYLENKI